MGLGCSRVGSGDSGGWVLYGWVGMRFGWMRCGIAGCEGVRVVWRLGKVWLGLGCDGWCVVGWVWVWYGRMGSGAGGGWVV